MIVSAHQPAYLPWLGYFHKIMLADIFVIMDDVQFEKSSFTNRNKIISGEQEVMLTIPVKQKGHIDKTIAQIELSDQRWRKKHLKSIEQAYRKAPEFNPVFDLIAPVLEIEFQLLTDYTNRLTKLFLEYLDIKTTILFASDLDIKSKKLDYVIELTNKAAEIYGANKAVKTKPPDQPTENIFLFGALGKDYADQAILAEANIRPIFQDYHHPEYRQMTKAFTPYISILDLIFNEPKNKLKEIIGIGNCSKEDLQAIQIQS